MAANAAKTTPVEDIPIADDPDAQALAAAVDDPIDGEISSDPEDAELAALEAAVAAEEAGGDPEPDPGGESAPAPEPVKEPANEPEPVPLAADADPATPAADADGKAVVSDPKDAGDAPMIPKARFDEAVSAAREEARVAREELAYQKGIADALRSAGANPSPAAPIETPEQRIAALREQKHALADDYDAGKINTRQWEEQRDVLNDQETAIRQEMIAPAQTPAPTTQAQADDLYMDSQIVALETAHPYTHEIKSPADWEYLGRKAGEELAAEGITLGTDARSVLIFKTRVAELTDRYGHVLTGKQLPAQPADPIPGSTSATPLSTAAQSRAKKLDQAAASPPDTSTIGASAGAKTELSEADIMAMSEDDLGALPDSVKARFDESFARQQTG